MQELRNLHDKQECKDHWEDELQLEFTGDCTSWQRRQWTIDAEKGYHEHQMKNNLNYRLDTLIKRVKRFREENKGNPEEILKALTNTIQQMNREGIEHIRMRDIEHFWHLQKSAKRQQQERKNNIRKLEGAAAA